MINRCRQKIELRMMRVFYIRRKRLDDGEKENPEENGKGENSKGEEGENSVRDPEEKGEGG